MNGSRVALWLPLIVKAGMFLSANCANILIFHHLATYSHIVATWPLAEALSSRGHQVSYISPYQIKTPNPNITVRVPEKMGKFVQEFLGAEFDINLRVQDKMVRLIDISFDFGYMTCETLLSSPDFQEWLSQGNKIDLVIIDNCMPECGIGLAYKLGAKYAIFNTLPPFAYEWDAYGIVAEGSSIPEMEVKAIAAPMGFLARVSNAMMSLRWRLTQYLYSNRIDTQIRKMLKLPDMPYIGDLMKKVSLIFSTSDVVTDYPRAMPPIVVNIAGIHCKESTKSLPENIETFIQANTTGLSGDDDGFVYISLGSICDSSKLPDNIKQVFFQMIKSFPNLKFLWKWNREFPKDIPHNLFLSKWFPQIDVLGHPNIRAFITQAGRPSALEALYNAVPMITFPILADQDYNAQRMVETGAAINFEIGAVTVEGLTEAVRKSVYDPSTKTRLSKLQKIIRDKPMSPSDTAVWWTEYVLRSEDTEHLRAAGINQNWFVRRQIDVWAFLSISIFLATVGGIFLIVKISRNVFKPEPKLKMS